MRYELVVGLEVHVELATRDQAVLRQRQPLRRRAEHQHRPGHARPAGGAAGAQPRAPSSWRCASGWPSTAASSRASFHRKNYFYPDMPKAYQISQYDVPLNVDGWLDLPDGTPLGIERAHLEEDTGKSTHVGGTGGRIHGSDYSLIDFNRAGVPLVEIVSRPDIRSAEQARQYVNELRAILSPSAPPTPRWRRARCASTPTSACTARASRSAPGARSRTSTRVRSLGRAIEYEARRQIDLLEAGEAVRQETRHWDESDGRTHTLRTKEDADDYRYFLEPDLVPLVPDDEWIEDDPGRAAAAAGRAPGPARRGHRRRRRRRGGGRRRRARAGRLRPRRRRRRRRRGAGARPRQGGVRRAGRRRPPCRPPTSPR